MKKVNRYILNTETWCTACVVDFVSLWKMVLLELSHDFFQFRFWLWSCILIENEGEGREKREREKTEKEKKREKEEIS